MFLSTTKNDKIAVAAAAAAEGARALLTASEELPYFGTVAKLINQLVAICDQCKCNKEAASALQVRFCRLADHLFGGDFGLAVIAQSRPKNTTITTFVGRLETILTDGTDELSKFTKGGFFMSMLSGSKPQQAFESLDQDMTLCLNELSVALQTTQLHEQAATYNVVCDIQDKLEQRGGLEGVLADPAQLQWLAAEIGADVSDLQVEISSALAALSSQVSVVDENVRVMKAQMDHVQRAVEEIKKSSTKQADLNSLQLASRPIVDRSQSLGTGAFGKVYRGTYNNIAVAVKEVTVTGALTAAQLEELSREVLMHSKAGNLPGVARMFGANLTMEPRCIVLELADGSLHDALHKRTLSVNFSLPMKLSVAAQLCATMEAISGLNIIHRDIKSSNVLLFLGEKSGVVAKLSDFGLTKVVNESTMNVGDKATPKGTPPYMAPELFRGQYSSASDMYAFTVLLNELLTEQVPFRDCSNMQILHSVNNHERPIAFKAEATDEVGRALENLIARGWHQDPALRVSFHELSSELKHLLHKAAECARVGDNAGPLTPPRPPATDDAAITSSPTPPSSLRSSISLRALSCDQLCALFDHCYIAEFKTLVVENQLKGADMEGAIDNAEDLIELGLNKLKAKLLFKRIIEWKTDGLPQDFTPPVSSATSKVHAEAAEISPQQLAADQGDATAQYELAVCYANGQGLPVDLAAAAKYFKLSADQGHVASQLNLAVFYANGRGVPANYVEAAKYFKLAAGQGHATAQYCVGLCYVNGQGLPVNYAEAVKHFQLSADQGNAEAQGLLAECYAKGQGVPVDFALAVNYSKLAADQGNAGGQANLAFCFANGLGVSADTDEAARYYKLAADQGHANAQCAVAMHYAKGQGVPEDSVAAAKYFKLAADQGHATAQYYLAACYASGQGVPMDFAETAKYLKLAADQGNDEAQCGLAECYLQGRGVSVNSAEAFKYYTLAASQGNDEAKRCLAKSYLWP